MKPTVWLTADDQRVARECARKRLRDAKQVGARDRFGSDSEDSHYWGALGEIAFARALDLPWECHSRVWSVPDVGEYEVRAIPPTQQSVYLKVKRNEPAARRVALVLHLANNAAWVVGWTTVGEVRRLGRWRDMGDRGAPAWFLTDLTHLRFDW